MESLNIPYVNYEPTYLDKELEDVDEINLNDGFSFKLNSYDNLQLPVTENTFNKLTWFNNYVPTITSTSSSFGSFSPTANSSYITQYFISKGLTYNQARGIYGNLMQESGGRLNAVSGDGNNSYGIAQWTGLRKKDLFKWCGTTSPTLNQQLDFLWHELQTTESGALADLKKLTSVNGATESFMRKFERPASWAANLKRRIKYANEQV